MSSSALVPLRDSHNNKARLSLCPHQCIPFILLLEARLRSADRQERRKVNKRKREVVEPFQQRKRGGKWLGGVCVGGRSVLEGVWVSREADGGGREG